MVGGLVWWAMTSWAMKDHSLPARWHMTELEESFKWNFRLDTRTSYRLQRQATRRIADAPRPQPTKDTRKG